ncbi:epoxide hydrolase 3-like [Thrips palmi]|uniref:Epoxide hydrolase 3-like n=1 Tax=Thrips palmi TaxID=161013 RepID=A0A6P8ZBH5_THRPL|nr:epoxide hydrolase 3-like [Thrips palmi]
MEWTASTAWVVASSVYIGVKTLVYTCYAAALMACRQASTRRWLFSYTRRIAPPKCLQDPALGQHGYVTVKGLKFHYVEKGDRSKPLMLFVHGFPDFWYSWRHQTKEFSTDYWTVAIDLRGCGSSAKPSDVFDYSMILLVDDIKGIVTELGRKKFILVASGWGAFISWCFLEKYPEMVSKYIMMNGPSMKVFTQLSKSFSSDQSSRSWYTYLFQMPYLGELYLSFDDFAWVRDELIRHRSPYVTDEDIEAYKYNLSQPGALTPLLHYYKAAYRTMVRQGLFPEYVSATAAASANGEPRPPGLFIFGAQDFALDVKCVVMLEFSVENLKTLVVKEAGHFVHQDEPVVVNQAMRSFLQ